MKKLIYSAAALAMAFFAASCQQENLEPVAQESTVTFSVELPGVQTKAIGDGFNVDQLVYEVWKTEAAGETALNGTDDEGKANATRLYQETAVMTKVGDEQKTVISLNLVHDQNYTILFWAQNSKAIGEEGAETPAYVTSDLTAVTYAKEVKDGSYLSNNENMAAFYGVAFLEKEEVEVPSTRRVELKRPFAQLNIGTKKTAEEYEITMTQSNVTISNVPTVFDVAQNTPASPKVSEYESFKFSYAALPTNPDILRVNDIPYHYVAMNYIFAGSQNVTVEYNIDATLTAKDSGATTEATVNNTVIEVPLKENYRTNIIGNLITSTTQYEVVIDASWDDVDADNWDGNVEEVWDERYIQEPPMVNGVYEISLASELAWLAAKVNGMPYVDPETNSVKYEAPVKFSGVTFKLVEDIDLVGEDNDQAGYEDYELTWIPIGVSSEFEGTFDGQGHTISNLVVRSEGTTPAGLFGKVKSGTVKNVTVLNADVQGHGSAAVIVAHGVCAKIDNCHVEEADVLSTPFEGEEANNVGGIVGYLSGETVGYVTNSSVKNATITGYRKVGGVAGAANQTAEVSGNTLENVNVVADQTYEYNEVKPVDLGPVVGYKHANATVENNTIDGVIWKLRTSHYEVVEESIEDGNTIKTYRVYTAEGLAKFSYMQNNVERDINLEIMNDIELPQYEIAANDAEQTYYFTETPITVTDGVPSGSNWVAIGDYNLGDTQINRWFYSKIEGNEYTISGLRMASTGPITAFVAYIDLTTGSISNLNLDDAVVHSTKAYTAGLVAWMGDGVAVKNCHLTNVHVNGDDNTGGVVGYCVTRHWNDFGTSLVENCSIDNSSTVNGDTNVGGIVGRNYGSIVKNSSNEASIAGNNYVGGIVGQSLHNGTGRDSGLPLPSYVIACKNIGKIAGANNVGGIIGESQAGSQKSYMVACYTAATVAEYSNLLIGNCHKTTDNFGSWGLKTSVDQKPLVDGTYTSCYAFTSAAEVTQTEVNEMNAVIDQYNTGRAADDPTFCPYKWTLTEGNLPVLQ